MDKVICMVCNRPLKDPISRKIKCGPKCLKILNEARNIYKAKSKKRKQPEIKGQINLFEVMEQCVADVDIKEQSNVKIVQATGKG
ncbi:hypothetical protein KTC96_25025 (plasmid) [Clostridium estertheticum]|uniref:hypothetical protein n=1 Tax=Clostridium estertheticum TaxID=238834 RepID=UPI001C7CEF2D|nr:hypothetical protein [Clostridium estertheticum]MBX4259792.1 hypothetical protein [Clostridium estertheticum]WLC73284.1 hypothetical protein KTC96_25025 [Clostridium estertheticum]